MSKFSNPIRIAAVIVALTGVAACGSDSGGNGGPQEELANIVIQDLEMNAVDTGTTFDEACVREVINGLDDDLAADAAANYDVDDYEGFDPIGEELADKCLTFDE